MGFGFVAAEFTGGLLEALGLRLSFLLSWLSLHNCTRVNFPVF
jgi:hypothetical protein